ncbi:hypothetical protein MTR_4g032945 [Medicago truncatula]|uniref:Uncharacterized protein n=1 Tax=Medicago truncatula TaxID=3880 RepID=A0A072UIL5_MEDTR|nr:hypothetical protein MTR_4g032945 [Medicago truncatula]
MWTDARPNSIHRQPNESDQYSCQFHVNFYDDQGSLGTKLKTLNKEVNARREDKHQKETPTSQLSWHPGKPPFYAAKL